MPHTEKRYKKGEIICRPKEMVMSMYNILYGSVGVYFDYGTPEQVEVVTLREGDFFNVMGLPVRRLSLMLSRFGVQTLA